ncbi:MAG: hypothetical protein ACRYGA_16455 [Janthinobacterium lividum]
MKKVIFFFWAAFLALAMHAPANAMLYRVVGANPNTVFPRGFQPWGPNPSLFDHVTGTSCNRRNAAQFARDGTGSRYLSLAFDMEHAIRVARTRLEQTTPTPERPDPTIWIYEVRPTQMTFNAVLTFERAGVNLNEGPLRVPYQNAIYFGEWVEDGPIAPERIREARQYRLVNGQAVEVADTAVTNPRYVDMQTTANPNPLPPAVITGATTIAQRARAVIGAAATGLMSACWCDSATVGPARMSIVADPVEMCLSSIQMLNDVVPNVRYFPTNGWEVID